MDTELKKCLMCKNPFCNGCPCGTEVGRVIKLIKEGQSDEAGRILFENNPLSAITGEVCPNHLYCMSSCILSKKGNAVDFSKIEREVSKKYLLRLARKKAAAATDSLTPAKTKKVLVAGSGPAGLSVAYYLTRAGFAVTVWEREAHFGGMLRYGIPNFRLDKTLINKLVKVMTGMGIKFLNKTPIKLDQIETYKNEYDFIILAVGASKSRKMGIEGEELPFVTSALDYLQKPSGALQTVIIGGGNVAIDCALTAKHFDHDSLVTLCYRRLEPDMKCYPDELELAKQKDVRFEYQMTPKRITEKGAEFERNGETITVPADKVVVAVGQLSEVPNIDLLPKDVYAIGDAVTGTSTVIKAVAAAKTLAKKLIDEYIYNDK